MIDSLRSFVSEGAMFQSAVSEEEVEGRGSDEGGAVESQISRRDVGADACQQEAHDIPRLYMREQLRPRHGPHKQLGVGLGIGGGRG